MQRKTRRRPAAVEPAAKVPGAPLRVDLRLPADLKRLVDQAAARNGVSTNQLLTLLAGLAVGFDPVLTQAVALLTSAPLAPPRRRRATGRPA